ncbi:uncharacterized protein LOC112554521 [Pomacea canaliculata]|uniref:uncharacterized protein LOC112554521 n=1 Tax=Pomacea canaliculata TaxID=400727 RepID=UPI000D73A017|nr:uncharacterized protein LOC112554521 [Pomacea canaliculata]
MSDADERASCDNTSDPEEGEEEQLATCGGSSSPSHFAQPCDQSVASATDDGADNYSMEVHLGGDNSQHASEISSISYQNLLEEGEPTGSILSRRGSEDSTDSYPPDFPESNPSDDIETFEASDLPLSEHYNLRIKQLPAKAYSSSGGEEGEPRHESSAKSVSESKDKKKDSCAEGGKNYSTGDSSGIENNTLPLDTALSKKASKSLNISEPVTPDTSAVIKRKRSPQINASSHTNRPEDGEEVTRKRNSLEIRNNIPVVGEVKMCDSSPPTCTPPLHGAKPKIKNLKQSPGLARRVCDQSGTRDSSSSERETEARRSGEPVQCPVHTPIMLLHVTSTGQDERVIDTEIPTGKVDIIAPLRRNVDIENEYDYVKYARVQHGNSYVGMRLAYSSSNDSLSLKRNSVHSHGSDSIDSSREPSPEKVLHQKMIGDLNEHISQDRVCEETLTEIPLNASDSCLNEGKKPFTLSPENTECDSVEVESVTSDGENSTPGFPTVEDGLSSSQASDAEEGPSGDHTSPSHMLRMKQKADLENDMRNSDDSSRGGPRDIDAQAIMNDLKAKREALDMAIADIKSAIQRSKQVALQSPYDNHQSDQNEPVWIRRDPPQGERKERQEEMRRVREEIERQQEEKYQPKEDKGEDSETITLSPFPNTHEVTVEPEDESSRKPRVLHGSGYDSDDECEEVGGMRYTRRNKGKKYAPLRKEDSLEHGASMGSVKEKSGFGSTATNQNANGRTPHSSNCSNHVNNLKHNSHSQYSSEENGSDVDPTSRGSYVQHQHGDSDTDEETDRLLQKQYQRRDQYVEIPELDNQAVQQQTQAQMHQSKAKEASVSEPRSNRSNQVAIRDPDRPEVLIEGVLFRARYLGSTQLVSEGQPSKAMRMMQAQEAVGRIKAPEGESQPSTDVDLFVSTEKIMVLNTDLQEIMMDHSLRTISYIADIGDILVIMARRRILTSPDETLMRRRRQAKILCHVFESDEAQLIAQSIGQAFQVAYLEFLKANGIEDPGLLREMDYQDVLNQQEIYGEELQLFANKDFHKEVIVPKMKGEPLGVVIVESGWGSMVPTVVLANMLPNGPAARCGQLNIGDQIISINGVSLVGLPLSACQTYVKGIQTQTVVKLTVVPCPPVVEVLIKRPDVKYQLGFSVQNGVICSLLRGGIAERGGVRVGHRIIEINNQSVVAVPHEKIVSLLANSVGEIHMKTMPTSIFRLLTGQDIPHYL